MRKIKFRAWDEKINTMVYPLDDLQWNNGQMLKNYTNIMQYTGLNDKNNKPIYESDIVHCVVIEGVLSYRNIDEYIGRISFENGSWIIEKEDEHEGFVFMDNLYSRVVGIDSNVEILGNIYENPELLTTNLNK